MSGGGGKGGSQTSSVSIPGWLEEPSKRAIARGEDIAQLDYMPYMGPDVAAITPAQQAAFDNTNAAAGAFGMAQGQGTGLPEAQDFGGVSGYSSYPVYSDAVSQFEAAYPELAAQRNSFFGAGQQMAGQAGQAGGGVRFGGGSTRDRAYRNRNNRAGSTGTGGYTSFRDMIDGGGAGQSGSTFQGGPLSGTLNNAGVKPRGSGSGSGRSSSAGGK